MIDQLESELLKNGRGDEMTPAFQFGGLLHMELEIEQAAMRARTGAAPPKIERPKKPVERHWRFKEIAEELNISYNTVRRTFINMPSVLHIGKGSRRERRGYVRRLFIHLVPDPIYQEWKRSLLKNGR